LPRAGRQVERQHAAARRTSAPAARALAGPQKGAFRQRNTDDIDLAAEARRIQSTSAVSPE